MKKLSFIILSILLSNITNAQIRFESGYFIDNNGEKTECLIKNIDWNDNPNKFEYKLTDNAQSKIGRIGNIREFAVADLKYIRSEVDIDRSSKDLNLLSTSKNPIFQKEVLFLKYLIEGDATLYLYEQGNLRRYFYSVGSDGNIQQLIHKKYMLTKQVVNGVEKEGYNKIAENNRYRQQLWIDMRCGDITEKSVLRTDYNESSLVKYFTKYNMCVDPTSIKIKKKEERDLFNLNLRPGVNFSSLSLRDSYTNYYQKSGFDDKTDIRLGIEAEYILPFNKNKWSIFVEPTYQSYTSSISDERTTFLGRTTRVIDVDYESIEFPIGLRHYMFLSDKSKLFINAAFVLDFELNIEYTLNISDDPTPENVDDIKTGTNVALGFGYKYNDRFSVEARYGTNRKIGQIFDYQSYSLILGYSLF
ncbi:outer membrane beta-barrel protein [Aquimarina aquimarini]|uniref:outer membrane beta-barrel protein n=1 Tax=Aquimarina aquimarini TaxID=1191734 RepID=UPI000D54FC3F|nr:outer membrane beta-barrel protein [Aquimarina aquimarini]